MGNIESIRVLALTTQAVTVPVGGLACLVENNSESATVYFKEKRFDGVDASSDNGWALAPGERTAVPVTALELSLAASDDADVRVMILD